MYLHHVSDMGAHSAAHIRLQCCFVPYKTFSRYKTLYGIHLVPPKTFSRNQIAWRLPALARRVWGGKDRPSVAYQSAWSGRQAYMESFLPISHVRCLWFPEARPNSWNITKCEQARSSAKPCLFSCHYKACRYLQRRFWYSHRDSNPNRQNRNLKSYPLDYGSKRGQGQMPPCWIDFPYLRCKVNYFND